MNLRRAGDTMEIGIVIREHAFLYETPSDVSDLSGIADEVLMGWALGILETNGRYCKVVTHYGYKGYIESDALRRTQRKELEDRDASDCMAVVVRGHADVRSVPDVKGRFVRTLIRGSLVTVLSRDEKHAYCHITTADGSTGYIPDMDLIPRKDSDRFLYEKTPGDFFLRQKERLLAETPGGENFVRKEVQEHAHRYLGVQYRWGGKSASGLDCSGLTFMSYFLSGILIYRDAEIVPGYPVKEIPFEKKEPGDLLFFPGHIALYLGHGKFIHSTGYEKSYGCVINSLDSDEPDYRKDLSESLLKTGSIF